MTPAREHRRPMPLGVKLKAALAAAGFTEEEIETPGAIQFDHAPALALRVMDEETGELIPPANDWRAIRPMRREQHLAKTCGRRPGAERTATTAGSDICNAAKVKRLERARLERQMRAAAGEDEIDRMARVADGDDRGLYPTTEEKRARKSSRRPGLRRRRHAR